MGADVLKNIYLFKDMTTEEMAKVAEATQSDTFSPGDEIFSQGDEAKALYVIKYGSVRVLQKGTSGDLIEVAQLATGSHFGEMAFLDNEKRSATVEAIEKSEILRVDYAKLRTVLSANPGIAVKFLRALAVFLSGRLRATTHDLSFAREMNLRHF